MSENSDDANGKVTTKEPCPPVSYAYYTWTAWLTTGFLDANAKGEILSST